MKKTLSLLLGLAVLLAGCITKNPQGLTSIPTNPAMVQLGKDLLTRQMASMPPEPPEPMMTRNLMPLKTAPVGAIFYDPFNSGVATPWTFYQGSHLFTTGILRLTVAQNAGMYAYVRTNWTNISVSADIKLGAGSWGAAVGLRYNPTNGANYQAWIYGSGRLTIRKYSNWYNTWTDVAGMAITAPGTTTNNIKLAITNNVLTAYLNSTQMLTYTDSSPLGAGGIDLGMWGSNAVCTADFDNVTVYDLSGSAAPTAPVLLVGLTNVSGLQGQNTTLNVTATGKALTYIWKTPNGTVVGSNIYTITNIQQAGSISVTITNTGGRVSSSAYLSMGTTNILSECLPTSPNTSLTLSWCPSPVTGTNAAIGGYKIYYGTGTVTNWSPDVYDTNQPPCSGGIIIHGTNWCRSYTNMVDVGTNLTVITSNLLTGITYYFAGTSYDTNLLESDFSSEVLFVGSLPPLPPTNVFLSIVSIGGGKVQLQSKVCPTALTTILYQKNLGQLWNVLATNVSADAYGNSFYIDSSTDPIRFYRALLQ